MPQAPLSDELAQRAVDAFEKYGSKTIAAKVLKMPRQTFFSHLYVGQARGMNPTVRKDAPRIYTPRRLGRMHMVIPDVQSKDGVRNEHLTWIGNYAVEKKPDVIVCIGDFWDLPSLSLYEKGKLPFEGRRYVKDVKAGRIAMEKFFAPSEAHNRVNAEKYKPELHFTLGNHEIRLVRLVDDNPEYEGKFSLDDLDIPSFGWKLHDFLKVVKIDGIEYAHYFTSGVMGRPVSSAAALLRERQGSATMGHVQYTDHAIHKKTQRRAMFCGTCYLHEENYLGAQGNSQRRQIIMKHEVEDGRYDLMEVSLKFLEKAYA